MSHQEVVSPKRGEKMVELNKEAKECLMELLRNKTDEQESNKGGEKMEVPELLCETCHNCGKHPVKWLVYASETGVEKIEYLPYFEEEAVEEAPVETRTGVTIKKGE